LQIVHRITEPEKCDKQRRRDDRIQRGKSKHVENNLVKSQTTIPKRLTFTRNIHTINNSHFKRDSESAWTDLAYVHVQ
jgi:hypothetical protein